MCVSEMTYHVILTYKKRKKHRAQDKIVFRTSSLFSRALNIVLEILTVKLESTAESYLGKDQFGFRTGHGT